MISEMNRVIKNQSTTLLYLNVMELYIYPFTFKDDLCIIRSAIAPIISKTTNGIIKDFRLEIISSEKDFFVKEEWLIRMPDIIKKAGMWKDHIHVLNMLFSGTIWPITTNKIKMPLAVSI